MSYVRSDLLCGIGVERLRRDFLGLQISPFVVCCGRSTSSDIEAAMFALILIDGLIFEASSLSVISTAIANFALLDFLPAVLLDGRIGPDALTIHGQTINQEDH